MTPRKKPGRFDVFVVGLQTPPGVTEDQVKEYLTEAVRSWATTKGAKHPLYNLDGLSVAVAAVPPNKDNDNVDRGDCQGDPVLATEGRARQAG